MHAAVLGVLLQFQFCVHCTALCPTHRTWHAGCVIRHARQYSSTATHCSTVRNTLPLVPQGILSDPFEVARKQHHLDTPSSKAPMPPSPYSHHAPSFAASGLALPAPSGATHGAGGGTPGGASLGGAFIPAPAGGAGAGGSGGGGLFASPFMTPAQGAFAGSFGTPAGNGSAKRSGSAKRR